jgi:glycosyltransferase involved in cell wall biosynthesis
MKVLHLIDSGGVYGAEAVLLSLAAEQRRRGVEAWVGSICGHGESERPIEVFARRRGIPVSRCELMPGLSPTALREVRRFLRASGADVVHSHGFKADVLAAAVPKRLRSFALITTLHGWTATSRFSKLYLYEALDRLSLGRMDLVIAVAERQRRVRALARLERWIVIANGIGQAESEVDATYCSIEEAVAFCTRAPTILGIGRLSREKNQVAMLRALALLRARGANIQLALVGDGPLRAELTSTAKTLGLESCVRLLGYVPAAHRLFPYVGALVMTSRTEGLPIAVLEAMRDRLPIISTPVGDIPDALGASGGWIVPENDMDDLAAAISMALTNRMDCENRTQVAHARWRERFSLERMSDDYERAYSVAVGRRSRA